MKQSFTLFLAFFVLIFAQTIQAQIYVNTNATGNNDGTSWENAFTELADALDIYDANDEIWVAAGTYLPNNPVAYPDDEKQTFYLYQNTLLYGGFNGTETLLTERDPSANVTILSGDLNGDDVDNDFETNREDNVINVVFIEAATNSTIDGFTISGGHADGEDTDLEDIRGGGLFTYGVVEVKNCIIEQNYSGLQGGAFYFRDMASSGSSVENCVFQRNRTANVAGGIGIWDTRDIIIADCDFIQNEAGDFAGGGIAIAMSSVSISGCDFIENSAVNTGGALLFGNFDAIGLELSVTDCYFENNTAGHGGAFSFNSDGGGNCNILITGCEFTGNTAVSAQAGSFPDGGALEFNYNFGDPIKDSIIVTDCILENNIAERQGGGVAIYNFSSTNNYFEFNNCQLSENSSEDAGGGFFLGNFGGDKTSVNLIDCDFTANTSNHGGASYCVANSGEDNSLLFSNCDFTGNTAITSPNFNYPDGGALGFQYFTGDPTRDTILIANCRLENNTAERYGGGIVFFNRNGVDNHLEVSNCEIIGNAATTTGEGGGMTVNQTTSTSSVLVRDTHFSNNTAEEVQSFFAYNFDDDDISDSRPVELVNCLFTDHNPNSSSAIATAAQNAAYVMTNCTFADNDCSAAALYASDVDTKLTLQNTILQSGSFPDLFIIPGPANSEVQSLGGNLVGSDALDAYLTSTDQSGADPLFEAGTYQLSQNSSAVDAGIIPSNLPESDLAGNDRIQGGCIDIGAYESSFNAGNDCLTNTREVLADPSAIAIYPNPVAETVNIALENNWQGELNLRIVNGLGQVVRILETEKRSSSVLLDIEVRDLPTGIYQVLISNGEMLAVSSFVKE